MKLFRAIAGISAIFILGGVAGALVTSLVIKNRIETFHEKGPPPIKPLLMDRMDRHLELTPEQKQAVGEILESTQKNLAGLRQDFRPRLRSIFSECFRQIEAQLTPSQKQRFQAMQKDLPRFMHHKRNPQSAPPLPGRRLPLPKPHPAPPS